ncbi:hypothetical protein A6F55_23865 [Prescottella equi]|nr:hypothetical protein A6F55_23865 [Prescottella equi]
MDHKGWRSAIVLYMAQKARKIGRYNEILVDELAQEIARLGYTQQELAHRSGLSRVTIGKMLRLESVMDIGQAHAIAGALGVELSDLTARVDDRLKG